MLPCAALGTVILLYASLVAGLITVRYKRARESFSYLRSVSGNHLRRDEHLIRIFLMVQLLPARLYL